VIPIQDGLNALQPGQIVYAVMYDEATNEPHRLVAASVGLAIPADKDQYGYLSEHKSFGQTDQKAGDYAEDLAATMLATALGIDFDPNVSYDERKDIWKLSDKIVRTRNITQSAIGDRDGVCGLRLWRPRCLSSYPTITRVVCNSETGIDTDAA
jgi:arginine decarboxylase